MIRKSEIAKLIEKIAAEYPEQYAAAKAVEQPMSWDSPILDLVKSRSPKELADATAKDSAYDTLEDCGALGELKTDQWDAARYAERIVKVRITSTGDIVAANPRAAAGRDTLTMAITRVPPAISLTDVITQVSQVVINDQWMIPWPEIAVLTAGSIYRPLTSNASCV